jgi:hypothetical protein
MPQRELLATYLRDHRAGAAAGTRTAERLRDHGDPSVRQPMRGLAHEIAEDRDDLDRVMSDLGISPSRLKSALAAAGSQLGRLKFNGRLIRRSPLSDVLELEALGAGVTAKRDLWLALTVVEPTIPELDADRLARLEQRAVDQLERIGQLHSAAAAALSADH